MKKTKARATPVARKRSVKARIAPKPSKRRQVDRTTHTLRQNQLPGVLRAFKKAIEIVGSQHKLADAIECSQATLWHWLHSKDGVVPAYAVPKIVVACGNRVTEHELRPDLF